MYCNVECADIRAKELDVGGQKNKTRIDLIKRTLKGQFIVV